MDPTQGNILVIRIIQGIVQLPVEIRFKKIETTLLCSHSIQYGLYITNVYDWQNFERNLFSSIFLKNKSKLTKT